MTGYPWVQGDPLLAADLNAAFANSSAISGGPFMPLGGGTMGGSIRGMPNQNLGAGGSFQAYTYFNSAISGVRLGGDASLSSVQTTSDTLDAGGGGLVGQLINLNSGGPGTSGNRVGQYVNFNYSGNALDKARSYPGQYGGLWSYANASGNAGGTTGAGNAYGVLWGGLSSSRLLSGATFWASAIGHEIDVGVAAGAGAAHVQGLKVVIQGHGQAVQANDYLIGLAKTMLTDLPLHAGISFGSVDGYWPVDATGTLIGTQGSGLATPPPMTAADGIDFSAVTFSGAAFKSTGFQIDGSGNTSITGQLTLQTPGSSVTDLTHGIQVYPGFGFNAYNGTMNVVINALASCAFIGGGIAIGNQAGPTWTQGSAAPAATAPVGSLYSRVGGAVGATLYVSRGAGTWAAVAGV